MRGIKQAVAMLIAILCITAVSASGGINPVSISKSEDGKRYEKVYILEKGEDSSVIPTAGFTENGTEYELVGMNSENNEKEERRIHTEKRSISSDTNDVNKIIPKLEKEITVETEDGYSGVLECDYSSLVIEASGYVTSDYTVSEERTYPNLSDADISLVPKSIEQNGNELTLCDISWLDAENSEIDGQEVVKRYTAKATYKGTARKRTVKGYTVTASYTGEVTKTEDETVTYRVTFCKAEKPIADKEAPKSYLWLVILFGVLILPIAGFILYRIIRRIRSGY